MRPAASQRDTAGFSGREGYASSFANASRFVLCDGSKNVQCQPVCMRIIAGDEFDTSIHQSSKKLDVARQPVKLGDN
jgi:hypothetical protein